MCLIGVYHWHQKWECFSQVKYLTGALCQLPVLEAPWTRSGVNVNAELHQLKELSLTEPGSSRTCFSSIDKGPFSFFQGKRSIQEGRRNWVFCHPVFVIPFESSTKCCPAWWNHFLISERTHFHVIKAAQNLKPSPFWLCHLLRDVRSGLCRPEVKSLSLRPF